jgi:glycogen synthase
MKIKLSSLGSALIRLFALPMGLLLGQNLLAAITFTITPSAVSNTYAGTITLQIGGIPTCDTIVARKFLDANTNGVVNGADWHLDMFSRENFNNAKFNGEKNEN